jgi:hypothetical protein
MNAAKRGKIVTRYREILNRARMLPGIEAAGIIRDVPLDPVERDIHFTIERSPKDPPLLRGGRLRVPDRWKP